MRIIKLFNTKRSYRSLTYTLFILPFKAFKLSFTISVSAKPKTVSKPVPKPKIEYRKPDLASRRQNERIHEKWPIQRMRVYAQKGKAGPELPKDGTIAYAYSRLDAWDWARKAGYGGMYQWASEWVLFNRNGTYVKTKYQEDYQHIKQSNSFNHQTA